MIKIKDINGKTIYTSKKRSLKALFEEASEKIYYNFTYADLTDCDLREVELRNIYLSHANLTNANFERAKLYNVDLEHCFGDNACFNNAEMKSVDLKNAVTQTWKIKGLILDNYCHNIPADLIKKLFEQKNKTYEQTFYEQSMEIKELRNLIDDLQYDIQNIR